MLLGLSRRKHRLSVSTWDGVLGGAQRASPIACFRILTHSLPACLPAWLCAPTANTHTDLVVDLHVPPGFAAPRRVSPQGAFWSASQSMLRWPLGTVGQGATGVLVAAFRVKGGPEAAAAGLARCHAVCRLQGSEGGTVTGVQLAQRRAATAPLQVEPGTCSWAGYVLVRPAASEQ